jgi:hypothetical protein
MIDSKGSAARMRRGSPKCGCDARMDSLATALYVKSVERRKESSTRSFAVVQ